MAKKKQDLSPEERLAAALVPEEEWPYALPDGWKWVYLSGILDVSKEKTEEFPPDTKYVGLENIEKDTGRMQAVDAEGIRSTKNIFEAGNILYGKLRPYLNKHGIAEFDGVCSTDILVFQTAPSVEKELLNRYFDLPQFISFAVSHSKGINLPRVSAKEILTARMPLPPLSEQRRLVARIESLFAKLDAAKDKVQSVLDSHETRKAALLHDAFAGKLTAKWREERGIPQSWKNGKLLDCLLEKPRNGYSPKAVNYPTKCKSMSLSATTDGIFKKEYYKYIDEEIPADSYLWLEPGDILIQRSNSLEKVGISAIYTGGTHEYIYPDLMMKLQVNNQNDPAYINYFLQRAETRAYFLSNATGIAGNMPKINQKTVSNTPVNYPSLTEQQEIVRILDRLLAREQRARQAAEETLTAIDRMKQSILARAFRGEL